MTRKELRELIRSTIKEYTGTGSSGGNATDGNNITSQRPFEGDGAELSFYNNAGAPYGGAEGNHYRKDVGNKGSFDFNKQVKF